MNQTTLRKAARTFKTDEKTIETFCNDFFSAPNIVAAVKIMDDFVESHDVDPEELDDFILYISKRCK